MSREGHIDDSRVQSQLVFLRMDLFRKVFFYAGVQHILYSLAICYSKIITCGHMTEIHRLKNANVT